MSSYTCYADNHLLQLFPFFHQTISLTEKNKRKKLWHKNLNNSIPGLSIETIVLKKCSMEEKNSKCIVKTLHQRKK